MSLCAAETVDREDIVKILIDRGANPDQADPNGEFPLLNAAGVGHDRTIQLLIECGTKIENVTLDRSNTLGFDLTKMSIPAAVALLEAGADKILMRAGNKDPIRQALVYDHTRGLPLLPNKYLDYGRNCLLNQKRWLHTSWFDDDHHDGEDHECQVLVKSLHDRGSQIESRDSLGRTVLHQAAFQVCESTVKFLLESGANPETRDSFEQNPLHMAVGLVDILMSYPYYSNMVLIQIPNIAEVKHYCT